MAKILDGTMLYSPERIVRQTLEDESVLCDRKCPDCKRYNLIAKWDWKRREYHRFRCQGLGCKYGNTGTQKIATQLPPLEFEI